MNVKFVANKMLFNLKNSAPTIMTVGGVIGFGVFGFLASKATLKVDEILDESREKVKTIHEVHDNPENAELYSDQQMQSDLAKVYGKTAFGLAKLYGPSAVVFGLSTFLVLKSHNMMGKRVAAMGAVITGLTAALKKQNERIAELYGEEKANDIWLGEENQKTTVTEVNEETGEEQKKKVTAKVVNEDHIVSPYAFVFDESNPNYIPGDVQHNVDFIKNTEGYLNRKFMNAQGYMFYNEIREAFGVKLKPVGQVVGNIYDPNDPSRVNCIDLGISHTKRQDVLDFVSGASKSFVIDPILDGIIVDDFFKFDKHNRAEGEL